MPIANIPEIYFAHRPKPAELYVYDFKMTSDVVKSKVNLSMNMFSFLQVGRKQVHCAGTSVAVDKNQSLLIKKGNCLWTELPDTTNIYNCKLLFFSEKKLLAFLEKNNINPNGPVGDMPYFIIANDGYINAFIKSLSTIMQSAAPFTENLLAVKLEEVLLYLLGKYGKKFQQYLLSLVSNRSSSFKSIIDNYVYSNLKVEEIAFLCNMSLSTFKRQFTAQYKVPPGKWLQDKRLNKAKQLLEKGMATPSTIYEAYGYKNLSNFSTAYKNKFGISPKQTGYTTPRAQG